MRLNYSEEEDYPGQFGLFQGNCQRSLNSKAGQVALRELREALIALPSKRLVHGSLHNESGVCAIGALALRMGHHVTAMPAQEDADDLANTLDIPKLVAWKIIERNDIHCETKYDENYHGRVNGRPYTPEERYRDVLAWVEKNIQERHA